MFDFIKHIAVTSYFGVSFSNFKLWTKINNKLDGLHTCINTRGHAYMHTYTQRGTLHTHTYT